MAYLIQVQDAADRVAVVRIEFPWSVAWGQGGAVWTCLTPGTLAASDGPAGFARVNSEHDDCTLYARDESGSSKPIVRLAGFMDWLYCAGGGTGSILPGGGRALREGVIAWSQLS